jgi:hypothetical protein
MLEKLLKLISQNYEKNAGVTLPLAYDPVQKAASFPLLSAYLGLTLAIGSLLALHFLPQLKEATLITLGFWAAATVFYLLHGGIGKAKIDLKDQEIEFDGDASTSSNNGEKQ